MMRVRQRMQLVQGDIVRVEVDAIVNAANPALKEGFGVCGAVFTAAGPELAEACDALGGCPVGDARATQGFWLGRAIIHAVGPIYEDGEHGEAGLLAAAHRSSLGLCVERGFRSIAFPAISTGIYGYPKRDAARIAISTVRDWLLGHELPETSVFVLFTAEDLQIYEEVLEEVCCGSL